MTDIITFDQNLPIDSQIKFGETVVYSPKDKPGIEVYVQSQFPDFVSEDHPRFVEFMEMYYQWMESENNPLRQSQLLLQNQDIDYADTIFEEKFFKEFLTNIPRNISVNKATILKHIKQFYTAKGTEKSFKFLFKLLFNTNVDLYYPKVDILKISDGKWIKNKSIKVINSSGNIASLRGKKIRGELSNSTAAVESVLNINEGFVAGHELILNISSITGTFLPTEKVFAEDNSVTATISPIPTSFKIKNAGQGYAIGDIFSISVENNKGQGATVKVIDVDEFGAITNLQIQTFGLGYSLSTPPLNYSLNKNQTDLSHIAKVDFILGALTDYPGYYLGEDGQLSTTKYIHDGEYYQQFSYVTYTDQSKNYYEDVMKRLIHPLGFKHFSGVRIQQLISATVKSAKDRFEVKIQYPGVIHPHKAPWSAKIKNKTEIIFKHDIIKDEKSYPLGASHASILREKFNYKPFLKYDANLEINQTHNPNYFGIAILDPKGNTPISEFEKLGLDSPAKIEECLQKRIDLMPDAIIYTNEVVELDSSLPAGFKEITTTEESD